MRVRQLANPATSDPVESTTVADVQWIVHDTAVGRL
jgi:hypothetical protein